MLLSICCLLFPFFPLTIIQFLVQILPSLPTSKYCSTVSLLNPQTLPRWNFSLYGCRHCLYSAYFQPWPCILSLNFFTHWLPNIISSWMSVGISNIVCPKESSLGFHSNSPTNLCLVPPFLVQYWPLRSSTRPSCYIFDPSVSFGHIPPSSKSCQLYLQNTSWICPLLSIWYQHLLFLYCDHLTASTFAILKFILHTAAWRIITFNNVCKCITFNNVCIYVCIFQYKPDHTVLLARLLPLAFQTPWYWLHKN